MRNHGNTFQYTLQRHLNRTRDRKKKRWTLAFAHAPTSRRAAAQTQSCFFSHSVVSKSLPYIFFSTLFGSSSAPEVRRAKTNGMDPLTPVPPVLPAVLPAAILDVGIHCEAHGLLAENVMVIFMYMYMSDPLDAQHFNTQLAAHWERTYQPYREEGDSSIVLRGQRVPHSFADIYSRKITLAERHKEVRVWHQFGVVHRARDSKGSKRPALVLSFQDYPGAADFYYFEDGRSIARREISVRFSIDRLRFHEPIYDVDALLTTI